MRASILRLRLFKRGKRGISTVIVAMLSLVLVVVIVGNVVLWSYTMNQVDWEKMQERIEVVNVESTLAENWTRHPTEYTLEGSTSWAGGGIPDLTAADGVSMTLRSYYSGTRQEDYVDNNSSDVDSSNNKGTQSDFTAEQYGPDSVFDTLTEQNTGISSTFGSSAGSSYVTLNANELCGSIFTSPTDSQWATISNVTWYGRRQSAGTGSSKAVLVLASTKAIIAVSNAATFSNIAQEWTNTFASPPSISANTAYILMMIFDVSTRLYYDAGSPNQGFLDTSNSYVAPTNPTDASENNNQFRIRAAYSTVNYELDREVQWTNANYSQPNEQLCVYAGPMGSETLGVDVWTGVAWQNVIANLAGGWNNVSVSSYLTSQTFTIRFKADAETNDPNQHIWNIDAVVLNTWSDEYTSAVELTGSGTAENWAQLNWTATSAWTTGSVNVTVQFYNFAFNRYQTSGEGYAEFTSDIFPNTYENSSQTITLNADDFRNGTGHWKVRIEGTKSTPAQFDLMIDWVEVNGVDQEGTRVTLRNAGSLTSHIIGIWVNNATRHRRYDANLFINSGDTVSRLFANVQLPSPPYTVKVVTERGNIAILQKNE